MKVVVASGNPVKVAAAQQGFEHVFGQFIDVIGISVESGVADQPMSDEETLVGAMNRLAVLADQPADFRVAIEGGIEKSDEGYEAFAWVVIEHEGVVSRSRTATFALPKKICTLIDAGYELGDASDRFFDEQNSKQKGGTVGILTGGLIDRTAYYVHPVILALIPFRA